MKHINSLFEAIEPLLPCPGRAIALWELPKDDEEPTEEQMELLRRFVEDLN